MQYNILFSFSPDLYKIIGNGFKCRFYKDPDPNHPPDGEFFIDYNPFVWRHYKRLVPNPAGGGFIPEPEDNDQTVTVTNRQWFNDTLYFHNEYDYLITEHDSCSFTRTDGSREYSVYYHIILQQYSTLANWNVCKAILI